MRRDVHSRQYQESEILALEIDGSAVTTTSSQAGLIKGLHAADVKIGAGADSNLVTITLKRPFGMVPQVLLQPRTLDCALRLEEEPTKTVIKVRCLLHSNLATGLDDADFNIFILGNLGILEGNY